MRTWYFGIAGFASLLLAACASPPPPQGVALPPSGTSLAVVSEETVVEVEPAVATSIDEPLTTEYVPVQATAEESLIITIPADSGWDNPEIPLTRRHSDSTSLSWSQKSIQAGISQMAPPNRRKW